MRDSKSFFAAVIIIAVPTIAVPLGMQLLYEPGDIYLFLFATLCGLITSIVTVLIYFWLRPLVLVAVLSALATFSTNIAFVSLFLVSYDRSISVFLLSAMSEHSEGISRATLEDILWRDYFIGTAALDRRIHEQLAIGNIEQTNEGCFALEKSGDQFVRVSRFIANLYEVDGRFLWPKVTTTINETC